MLARLSFLAQTLPKAYFCSIDDQLARQLTSDINNTKSVADLKLIINTNQGNFNLVHISVLLKKINTKPYTLKQQLLETTCKEVKRVLSQVTQPNISNSRAIANIIGYTGNSGYTGFNEILKQINYHKLFRLVNQKQFVMVVTGLLKLGLVEQVIDADSLQVIVGNFVAKCQNIGYLISVWRNLIKGGHCTEKLNQVLMNKIVKCSPSRNIKDLGYLAYCYSESPYIKSEIPELTQKIVACSKQFLSATRINVFELCIVANHLAKVSKISKIQLQLTTDILQILTSQYIRIVQGDLDLRSLANGYLSLINLKIEINQEVYMRTVEKFVDLLQVGQQDMKDNQSVTSLFLQLITTRPFKTSSVSHMGDEQLLSLLYLKQTFKPLRNYLFNPKNPHILHLSVKEYQKLLYSFFLVKKQDRIFQLSEEQTKKLEQSLFNKSQFSQLQITSIMQSFSALGIKNQRICLFLKEKLQKLQQLSENQCWMGLKSTDCLGCFANKNKFEL